MFQQREEHEAAQVVAQQASKFVISSTELAQAGVDPKQIVGFLPPRVDYPVFNLEAVYYDEKNDSFVIHEYAMLKGLTDKERFSSAVSFLKELANKRLHLLDYFVDVLSKEQLLDYIATNREGILYDIAFMLGAGFRFDEKEDDGLLLDVIYGYAFDVLPFRNPPLDDYNEFVSVLQVRYPELAVSYIKEVLELNLPKIADLGLEFLPINVGLICDLLLKSPINNRRYIERKEYASENTLENSIEALATVGRLTYDAHVRYSAFLHKVGHVSNIRIVKGVLGIEFAEYMNSDYETRGRMIVEALCRLHECTWEEKESLVTFYNIFSKYFPNQE